MTSDRKRPAGPPPSAGVLARYSQFYAREIGVTEGRVRAWVAYMIMARVLERTTGADGPKFMVKGGVALELRLRDRARATKDIDVVLRDKGGGPRRRARTRRWLATPIRASRSDVKANRYCLTTARPTWSSRSPIGASHGPASASISRARRPANPVSNGWRPSPSQTLSA
jgi:hypothetical protein